MHEEEGRGMSNFCLSSEKRKGVLFCVCLDFFILKILELKQENKIK